MWLIIGILVAALLFGMAMRRKERRLPLVGAPRKIDVAGILLSVTALATEIYLIDNTDRVNSGGLWQWGGEALLLIGYLGGGLIIGRWYATLLLPLLAILIAIPAGENPAYTGDIPWVAFIYVFLLPVWIALVAVGVGIHKLAVRFRGRREPRTA